MIIQYFEAQDLFRDIILILRFFAIFYVFFIVIKAIKRMKKDQSKIIGSGFIIFLVSIAMFHFLIGFDYFYLKEELKLLFYYLRIFFLFGGIICFTFCTELEYNYHTKTNIMKKQKFPYQLTIISVIGSTIIFFLPIESNIKFIILFLFTIIPLGIIYFKFFKPYNRFEMIKHSKQLPWVILGFAMILLSCLFNSSYMLINYGTASFHIGTPLIILGPIFFNRGWSNLPLLPELDWMTRMDKLLIIEFKTSSLIYLYSFKKSEEADQNNLIKDTVTGAVMGGLNLILQKILEVDGHIKSLEYGDKRLYFSQGINSICILITTGISNEFTYRLEMFIVSFEKTFENYLGINWRGDLTIFERTKKLILDHFVK